MDGSFGLIFNNNNNEVLMVKRCDIPIWVFPGGGIEKNESPEDACIREVFEETGFNVKLVRKIAVYTRNDKKEYHTYECKITGGAKTLSRESKEIEYQTIAKLPEMIHPYIPVFIEDALSFKAGTITKSIDRLPMSSWIKALKHPFALFKYILTRFGIHWNT